MEEQRYPPLRIIATLHSRPRCLGVRWPLGIRWPLGVRWLRHLAPPGHLAYDRAPHQPMTVGHGLGRGRVSRWRVIGARHTKSVTIKYLPLSLVSRWAPLIGLWDALMGPEGHQHAPRWWLRSKTNACRSLLTVPAACTACVSWEAGWLRAQAGSLKIAALKRKIETRFTRLLNMCLYELWTSIKYYLLMVFAAA
jgi:hypothetical protein